MTKNLHRIVYRSESRISHDDEAALDALFRTSIRNNNRHQITGALALPDGKFVQAIEGEKDAVDALMLQIIADERHSDVAVLGDWFITARLFAGWAMGRPDPTPLSEQAFRIVTEDGSGAQVTGILVGLQERPGGSFFGNPGIR